MKKKTTRKATSKSKASKHAKPVESIKHLEDKTASNCKLVFGILITVLVLLLIVGAFGLGCLWGNSNL